MKIFISWSGERSKQTAEALKEFIEQVIQSVEVWISTMQISKGAKWNEEINHQLQSIGIGIICLTKDNLKSEWIHYEAGALSKNSDSLILTFLLDNKPLDINPPLSQFNHTLFNKIEIKKLIFDINAKLGLVGEKELSEKTLTSGFEAFYDNLESQLKEIEKTPVKNEVAKRSVEDMIEEILETVRNIGRPQSYFFPQSGSGLLGSQPSLFDFADPNLKISDFTRNLLSKGASGNIVEDSSTTPSASLKKDNPNE